MKRSLGLIVLVGCGEVQVQQPGGATGGEPPGSFVWQQNMFGSFPVVTLANDQPYVSASQFAPLDLGKGILVPAGGHDVLAARFDSGGHLQWAWRHGGLSDGRDASLFDGAAQSRRRHVRRAYVSRTYRLRFLEPPGCATAGGDRARLVDLCRGGSHPSRALC